jgi:hypothetical protein
MPESFFNHIGFGILKRNPEHTLLLKKFTKDAHAEIIDTEHD